MAVKTIKLINMSNFLFIVWSIAMFLVGVILAVVVGWYFLKDKLAAVKKQVESVDEELIKNALNAMGRKPSQEEVARIKTRAESAKTKKTKKKKGKK